MFVIWAFPLSIYLNGVATNTFSISTWAFIHINCWSKPYNFLSSTLSKYKYFFNKVLFFSCHLDENCFWCFTNKSYYQSFIVRIGGVFKHGHHQDDRLRRPSSSPKITWWELSKICRPTFIAVDE